MTFTVEWIEHYKEPARNIEVETPAGQLLLTVCGDLIINTDWNVDSRSNRRSDSQWQNLFDAYWSGKDHNLEVKLLVQGTPYRHRVWEELCRIPFGETRSYAALAKTLGSSPRAIGNACRDNPYAPIIPCHRVVSASGLGGYCGVTEGSLMDIKIKLLRFEEEHCR
jgi:methylated-DNA-[protein]-cysteine S-methyltransferase